MVFPEFDRPFIRKPKALPYRAKNFC